MTSDYLLVLFDRCFKGANEPLLDRPSPELHQPVNQCRMRTDP
jgi:hypothetical protein